MEDDERVRLLLMRFLQAKGHRAVAVLSAEEALFHLQDCTFDILITDYQLPGMTGLELVRRLGPRRERVILISGEPRVASESSLAGSGVHVFLPKPLNLGDLETALQRLTWPETALSSSDA